MEGNGYKKTIPQRVSNYIVQETTGKGTKETKKTFKKK